MNIFDFFFSVFSNIMNVYNVDFFGFGFTWLEFILSSLLIIFILKFLIGSFKSSDSFNFFSISSLYSSPIKNDKREQQIVNNSLNSSTIYAPSGFIDVWGDGTYVIPK